MDHLILYKTIEMKRREDENLSFPFLVQTASGKIHYVWFSFEVTGNVKTGTFVHINEITVLQEDEKTPRSASVAFDMPFLFDPDNRERYAEYLQQVVQMEDHFSEEAMNRLLQDYGMKPFFHAFQCVRNYVRTHEKDLVASTDEGIRAREEKNKAVAEKLIARFVKQKTAGDENRAVTGEWAETEEKTDRSGSRRTQEQALRIMLDPTLKDPEPPAESGES